MGRIELFNHLLKIVVIGYLKQYKSVNIVRIWLEYLINRITDVTNTQKHLTVCKQMIAILENI